MEYSFFLLIFNVIALEAEHIFGYYHYQSKTK